MAGPVSAFAARKVTYTSTTSARFANASSLTAANGETKASAGPRKRVRGAERSKSGDLQQITGEKLEPIVSFEARGSLDRGSVDDSGMSTDRVTDGETECSDSESQLQSTAPIQKLSTFALSRSNILSDTEIEWTVRLHPNDTLALLGQYDVWIRSGAVNILGAVILASSKLHRVYAPSTHSIPPMKAVPNPYGTGNPPVELTILPCGSRIRMLRHLTPKFARLWNAINDSEGLRRSFVNVRSSADDPYQRPLRLLEPLSDWQAMVSRLLSKNDHGPVAVLVCGPKGAGKSAFCRMLANALMSKSPTSQLGLNPVAFLDLDPGQPEFSPPGEVSLIKLQTFIFGPPFTHPAISAANQVLRAHHFGYISPKEDPQHYYNCALDLFSHYRKILSEHVLCPLIINCSGWIQGSGLELLTDLIHGLYLTDSIYMSTSGPEEVTDALGKAAARTNTLLHQLTSQVSGISTRTAPDLRMMQTLSYFHLDEPEGVDLRWNPYPLASIAPLVVHYGGSKQDIFAIMVVGDEHNPELLDSILDGCLVSITVLEAGIAIAKSRNHFDGSEVSDQEAGDEPREGEVAYNIDEILKNVAGEPPALPRTPTGIPYIPAKHHVVEPLSPGTSHSLGQALVRRIDPQTQTLHLLTPVPVSNLVGPGAVPDRKIVLVRGKLDTPTWAYAEQAHYERERARRRECVLGVKEDIGSEDIRTWAERQPWASTVEGGRTGSGKIRRIRRDIRYRGYGAGESSH